MKTKTKIKRTKKTKHYAPTYLALILLGILLLEGGLFTMPSDADWRGAASILDVTAGVNETSSDLGDLFQPVAWTVNGINEFYSEATDAMISLLDLTGMDENFSWVFVSVSKFYNQASVELAELLDFSPKGQGSVAGISIEVTR